MNKQIEVLYKIFELELVPPFELRFNSILNKHSNIIGRLDEGDMVFLYYEHESSLINKIKRTFNISKLSDNDLYYIAKHLYDWLQYKLPKVCSGTRFWNIDTYDNVYYPKRGLGYE